MSSISAISGKPPTDWNASRFTNIAWSPVAMPVSRERRFMSQPTMIRSGLLPSIFDVEAAPGAPGALEAVEHEKLGRRRQPGVGVQEQQHVAGRLGGAGIHL